MGSGLNSAAREIGSALGVAVVGSVLSSQFASILPSSLREQAGSVSQALSGAERLGAAVQAQAVNDFTSAMAAGYRVIAVVVLAAAITVALGLRSR